MYTKLSLGQIDALAKALTRSESLRATFKEMQDTGEVIDKLSGISQNQFDHIKRLMNSSRIIELKRFLISINLTPYEQQN